VKEHIEKIREELALIESASSAGEADSFERNFDALELPQLVAQIVDFLQPRLLPYEAAIYWYLFRHSIVSDGTQRVRTSVRALSGERPNVRGQCEGVITSGSGQSSKLGYRAVQDALQGLEQKDVLRKDGDTTREGTPYFVRLPEEIPWCVELIKSAQLAKPLPKPMYEKQESDFYNIPENRLKVFERDGYLCYKCGKLLTRFSATLDHLQPVSRGGTHSYTNLATSCLHCNSRRGNRPVMDSIASDSSSTSR
jgi:HNH endonuclease